MTLHNILYLVLITLLPFFELRLSIPWGLAAGMDAATVFAVCVATNIALGPVVYFFLDRFVHIFLRVGFINSIWERLVARTQRRVEPYVEKYGLIGVALFVAIPLPGSGSYTGALAAYLLGLSYKRFAIANLIGVLIAGTIVIAVSLGVLSFANGL